MELVVEMEVALKEEIALVDVIARHDGAWMTALWTAWDTAEAIDLDISSNIICEFLVSETEIVMWLVTCQGVKLPLIEAPMQLNLSLWRPNPEN